jgi:hypothetical protein
MTAMVIITAMSPAEQVARLREQMPLHLPPLHIYRRGIYRRFTYRRFIYRPLPRATFRPSGPSKFAIPHSHS